MARPPMQYLDCDCGHPTNFHHGGAFPCAAGGCKCPGHRTKPRAPASQVTIIVLTRPSDLGAVVAQIRRG